MPFQKGNQLAGNSRKWRTAINRALEKQSKADQMDTLTNIAGKLIEAAENGDQWAIKELGDRVDGKPAQSMTLAGDENNPIKSIHEVVITALTNDSGNNTDT